MKYRFAFLQTLLMAVIILGPLLVSCAPRNPFKAAGGKPVTIVISANVTPIPTPLPISLSPIDARNADQIQPLCTIHLKDGARAEDLLAISPDKRWVALTPKDGAPLHLQRL